MMNDDTEATTRRQREIDDEVQLAGALALLANPVGAMRRSIFAELTKREAKEKLRKLRLGSEETQNERQRLADEKRARKALKRSKEQEVK